MKRQGHLFDEATSFLALCQAARRAARGKRSIPSVARFLVDLEPEVLQLQRELLSETYRPLPLRHFWIRDPKTRLISAAHFRDRVVHHAVCAALEPLLESYAIFDSYACRPGKGSHRAIERAQLFARRYPFCLKLDVEKFFDSVDHETLRFLLSRKLKDHRLLKLMDRFLEQPLPGCPPGRGLPIGNLTSQHFANFYLGRLDHFIKEELRLGGYLRYMDDFLCFGRNKKELWASLERMESFLQEKLCLTLRQRATQLWPVGEGIPFLGWRIFPGVVRMQASTRQRFCRGYRSLLDRLGRDEIDEESFLCSAASRMGHLSRAATLSFRRGFFASLPQGAER